MDLVKNIKLIEYSKTVDALNSLTHGIGAVLSLGAMIALVIKAVSFTDTIGLISCIIYGVSMLSVYVISAVYHGLPPGKAKLVARLFDHLAIPLAFAGTCTPCALITLRNVSAPHAVIIFVLAWFLAVFGVTSKLFFFEKMRKAVMWVYFSIGFIMLFICIPLLKGGTINNHGFYVLITGSFFYCVAGLFCYLGIKKPYFHILFHIFIIVASGFQFFAIYQYILH